MGVLKTTQHLSRYRLIERTISKTAERKGQQLITTVADCDRLLALSGPPRGI